MRKQEDIFVLVDYFCGIHPIDGFYWIYLLIIFSFIMYRKPALHQITSASFLYIQ